ncbi:low temperature requirement protein A [Plastoroseomonas arctica]|uniref:Low temperature requirement protein A n=1 Tax=Plastoroseomonas arctica TaxID=1509237 RepID=A0AAF1KUS1_9PROT|nr:low temperature requirement protein A [Plastoroseomonas arctica]MBR0656877.1 low temperature requirement protein A [Plastoroseomonas arctica]
MDGARGEGLLRPRGEDTHAKVGYAELFFDLVFVFAVTQLSHTLLESHSVLDVARTCLLFLAVWWVWIYTGWVTNWVDPERAATRLMLFALMGAGLVMSMSLPEAFAARGLHFALAYVGMQVGRTVFMIWAIGPHIPALRLNFVRIFAWLAFAGIFWIAGGLADAETRLTLWIVALAIEYVSPLAFFWTPGLGRSTTEDWQVEGAHLAERCALFIIIGLGESILVSGATFAKQSWDAVHSIAFATCLLGSVAMWWVYFHVGAERGTAHIVDSNDPGRIARNGYTYLHVPIVGGVVLCAVADEIVLAHPQGAVSTAAAAAIIGGPALYLAGCGLFKRMSLGWFPLSHRIGLGALVVCVGLAFFVSPLVLSVASTAALMLVAAWEYRSLKMVRR